MHTDNGARARPEAGSFKSPPRLPAVFLLGLALAGALPAVDVREQPGAVSIENEQVSVTFDLRNGSYQASNRASGRLLLAEATIRCAGVVEGEKSPRDFTGNSPGASHSCQTLPLADSLGLGRSLLIASQITAGPKLLLKISLYGQFVPPYETARKWVSAVKALGGIPMIYVQTGFRSQDYADRFPDHMIFNRSDAPHLNEKGEQQYRDREKKVLNYDLDGKKPFHVSPMNRDGVRSMLTMSYVVSGTLIVVPSVGRWTPELYHDLGRIFPFHSDRRSARPVDAFINTHPRVYDYKVNADWHQLTFYNTSLQEVPREKRTASFGGEAQTVAVDLAGDTAFGGLGLDPAKEYYTYDFWNDRLVGRFKGTARLEQTLRPGEARMMSLRSVQPVPQFLSSNRHLMQGLVDHLGCDWDESKRELRGVSLVVGGETYRAIFACNGSRPTSVVADDTIDRSLANSRYGRPSAAAAHIRELPEAPGLAELTLQRPANGPVAWTIRFAS